MINLINITTTNDGMVMLIITISVGCLLAFMSRYTSPCLCIFFPNFILCVMKSDWEIKNVMKQTFSFSVLHNIRVNLYEFTPTKFYAFINFGLKWRKSTFHRKKYPRKKSFIGSGTIQQCIYFYYTFTI